MYKEFYKLARNPFEITPDPSFLFPTRWHNEALASLYYGVRRHKGFVVLTGEVGTGKTLLIRCLLELLRRSQVRFAYVFNPRLSPHEFLQYIVGDLGLGASGKTKGDLLCDLNGYLFARHERKLTTVLVIDEAQHLSVDVLEEIRLLTNLETAQENLLQILLVGQPELDQKLDSSELRQLKQRIALRCHLEALDEDETAAYILRRLQLSRSNPHAHTPLFPDATIAVVYDYSRGIPRLINILCENALLQAYSQQAGKVTPDIVEEVAFDLRLQVTTDAVPKVPDHDENSDMTEVRQAAKALLQLHDYLRGTQKREQSAIGFASRAKENEPYI